LTLLDGLKNVPIFNKVLSLMGIDKPIFYTILSVIWASIAGVLSIVFIVDFLSLSQQGYWYTFLSLGALATFAELGFTTIITQFISHEYVYLKEKDGKLYGDASKLDGTISLVKFSLKFYLIITSVAFIMLSIIGVTFLMSTTSNIYIFAAWIFYSFTGAFMLLISLFGAILRGFNKVEVAQKIILVTSFFSNIAIWIALYLGLNIWALGIGGAINILISLYLFFTSEYSLWMQIFRTKVKNQHNWLRKTLPLQWRYAISWASGYFIFQFIVPVAMIYAGADVAGKLGLSLVVARAVQTMANSWGSTKIPQFNMFVEEKKRGDLDNLLKTIQKQSLLIFIAGSIALIFVLAYIFPLINWNTRVLPTIDIVLILIAEGANLVVFNWAYYLRSHKEEPYMRMSAVSALGIGIGVWASYYFFASSFIALFTYCVMALVMLIPAWKIFVKKSKEYNITWSK
jgi:O-antigen/teichoic acid export membrane protein